MEKVSERLLAFDLLRSVMLILLVVFHAGVSFMTTSLDDTTWEYKDASTHILFDGTLAFIHALRHPTFFIISGFVTELMFRNYSRREVFVRRLKRVFLPFLIVLVLVGPLVCVLLAELNGIAYPFSTEIMFPTAPAYTLRISTSYVWFLYYLLIFSIVHVVFSILTGNWLPTQKTIHGKRFLILPFALTLLFCATLVTWNQNTVFGKYYLLPDLVSVAGYFCFYIFGVAICRLPGSLDEIQRKSVMFVIAGALAFTVQMVYSFFALQAGRNPVDFDWVIMFSSSISAIYLSLGAIGLALKYYKKPVTVITYISRSSYFFYLSHFPILLVILIVVAPLPIHAFLKFGIILSTTVLITALLNHLWMKVWKNNPPI